MKKIIFGSVLFLCGFIGMTILVVLSILHSYATGFNDFLSITDTMKFMVGYSVLLVIGLLICINECYGFKNIKKKIMDAYK